MRRWNAILTAAILALFLLHGISGAFQLFGAGPAACKAAAWAALALTALHTLFGLKLTADTLAVWRTTGVREALNKAHMPSKNTASANF